MAPRCERSCGAPSWRCSIRATLVRQANDQGVALAAPTLINCALGSLGSARRRRAICSRMVNSLPGEFAIGLFFAHQPQAMPWWPIGAVGRATYSSARGKPLSQQGFYASKRSTSGEGFEPSSRLWRAGSWAPRSPRKTAAALSGSLAQSLPPYRAEAAAGWIDYNGTCATRINGLVLS